VATGVRLSTGVGVGVVAATLTAGLPEAAALAAGVGVGMGVAFACASWAAIQASKSVCESAWIVIRMLAWLSPQNSAHSPANVSGLSATSQRTLFSFGIFSAAMFTEPAVTEIEEMVGLIQEIRSQRS